MLKESEIPLPGFKLENNSRDFSLRYNDAQETFRFTVTLNVCYHISNTEPS